MDTSPILPAVELETGPDPRHAVIWMHGLGADGYDFEPVVEAMDLSGLPPIRFVFPHAPERPVTINGGYVMRAWYDIVSLDFNQRREDPAGVRQSAGQVLALVAREHGRGVPAQNLVLAGFSQGGAIALHTALRHAEPLAGVLALSTYLPLADSLAAERNAANDATPIFMAHGHGDTVIPYEFAQRSHTLLRELGYPITWQPYFTEHSVCMEEIRDIARWLRGVLLAG